MVQRLLSMGDGLCREAAHSRSETIPSSLASASLRPCSVMFGKRAACDAGGVIVFPVWNTISGFVFASGSGFRRGNERLNIREL